MQFFYSGRIEALRIFYSSMKKINVQVGTFEHTYNGVISDVIFDTRSAEPWHLIFIKRGIGDILAIPIKVGYYFTIEGDEKYKEFINYFGIGRGKGQFKIKDFVVHLSKQIPPEYRLTNSARRVILKYDKLDNESEGIYPIGITNWEVVHEKNPGLPTDKYHRTSKNLLKTRELYPRIYSATKDMDITIIYGAKPGERTSKIKECKFD